MNQPLNLTIRPTTRAGLERALAWAEGEGWSPGLHDAAPFHAADPDGFLVGELAGEPVACIAAVAYDSSLGSIGLYIVRPEFRGRGLGFAVWSAGMARLRCRAVGLDGVITQQTNYERSDFRVAYRNIRYEGTGVGPAPAGVVDLAEVPFGEVLAYDRGCFAAARPAFLREWIQPSGGAAVGIVREGRLAGYGVLRPCRVGYKVGPLFADDERAADELYRGLAARSAGVPLILDAPEANPAAIALARRHGMREVFATLRMYKGAVPRLPLDRIFGVTSLELG